MTLATIFTFVFYLLILVTNGVVSVDYKSALTKSLLYYEAQRSGRLPANQRVQWRGDSGLYDGRDFEVDLVGGYYDAGDNVKFGFPMAFMVTMLGWSVVEFESQLEVNGELDNALAAIKWGTDYLLKSHPQPDVLYGEVGDGNSDHQCWQRPEDMTTPRTPYKIDAQHPGADLAGETAAAFAAASIAFKNSNRMYSKRLLGHAKQLFEFAQAHPGMYQNSIGVAGGFYPSSGFEDELLWAAAWLDRATQDPTYSQYLNQASNTGGTRSMFSWDDKFVGAQVLVAKNLLEGRLKDQYGNLGPYKNNAEQFICNCVQKGSSNVGKSGGGLLWWNSFNNLQYVTTATFVITTYADILANTKNTLNCPAGALTPNDLIAFARSQVDYILGSNPKNLSYMVGYGTNYPQRVHHRGASIVSIKRDSTPVSCQQGFSEWYYKDAPNPNIIEGAIVGGPDPSDNYDDSRGNYQQNEAATANTAPLVGVLARMA
ncbi:OLC1v1026840C1 [Oldenlandia corymbosa var. corymbosa]|uniref:Endoglucanase n=1 Tax=Oldenlandia corymbosa var. corymbosa TaxID=529605 RepID=A0AAV1C7Z7_OLDCO|nr:OLC1v1026840C1 [Oldenlandia corymbosa var. corymbosa]